MHIPGKARAIACAIFAVVLAVPAGAAAATVTSSSPPAIYGTAQQGQTLSETHGTYTSGGSPITPGSYSYQWQRCASSVATCQNIVGATARTYTLTASDVGNRIRVLETAYTGPSQTGTKSAPAGSALTRPVTAQPPAHSPVVIATTRPASGVTTTKAVLNGLIDTGGASSTWQFQYGQDANYNKGTPVQTIGAGKGQVPVSWKLIRLRPNTTYHYRLVAFYTKNGVQTASYGRDRTFVTQPTGALLLRSRLLAVKKGFVTVPLRCKSQLKCVSQFNITAAAKVGKSKQVSPVVCTAKVARIGAGMRANVKAKLTPACKALIKAAHLKRLKAKFTARPRTGQRGLIKTVTLIGL